MTAHPIVVSDSYLDDGPAYLEGFGVEDQRSILRLGATEEAFDLGVAPNPRRAHESRTPRRMRALALAALKAADLRELARAPAKMPGDRKPAWPALATVTRPTRIQAKAFELPDVSPGSLFP
ncbi:MAG: hypothetical protein OXT72_01300 [Gammaproteobacteria bacterium]|nr:hypothetical protein [Gammaproteobacteria bacterium]MDE0249090.1 hypothetical protein [Gammaproteobacteria bacterium]